MRVPNAVEMIATPYKLPGLVRNLNGRSHVACMTHGDGRRVYFFECECQ